ncbi:MAG: polysaccharide biosynthesis protein [Clostridia bacterium]|nr:polysaccharide biosynthesis protein [Clostridia bacterium]
MRSKAKKRESKGAFLKGAIWIAAGGFIAKVIGALYRIPLTNLIGGHGLGLYQLVYPVYCLLLTVSATGIPSSIAKLTAERIAQGGNDRAVLKTAMKLFIWIGLAGTLLMAVIAPFLSKAQGSEEVLLGYYALAPSVLLVSIISVFRGWFQGRNRMFPTALSEVVEQVVKVGFGLLFAYLFRESVVKAVIFLLLSVSLSELVTLLVMWIIFKRVPAPTLSKNDGGRVAVKTVLKMSIPVTLNSILIPLSGLLDSILAPRLLGGYASDAVALFGLFSGGAVTVINLPVSVCYGLAAASIPRIATAREKGGKLRKNIFFSLGITAFVSGISAVGLYLFAEPAVKIIFRSLTEEELNVLVGLVKALSVSALTLSCVQTLSACLTAQGKPQYAALSMMIALTAKTGLYVFWLRDPSVSVFGLAYATNIAYAVAFLLDLVYNMYISKRKRKKEQ